jgi:hypothetical protein
MVMNTVRYLSIDLELAEYDVEEARLFHRSYDELVAQAPRLNSHVVCLLQNGIEITAESYTRLNNCDVVVAVCTAAV